MHACIHAYTYTHTCIITCAHTCMHRHTIMYTYVHAYMQACIHAYIHVCMCASIQPTLESNTCPSTSSPTRPTKNKASHRDLQQVRQALKAASHRFPNMKFLLKILIIEIVFQKVNMKTFLLLSTYKTSMRLMKRIGGLCAMLLVSFVRINIYGLSHFAVWLVPAPELK